MKYENKFLIGTASFFVLIFIVNIVMIYLSVKSDDGLVEENYYTKGLNYQTEITGESNQKKLGWQISFEDFRKKDHLFCIVSAKDKNGFPIINAKVSLNFFRPTMNGFDKNILLSEVENGVYKAETDLPLPGLWDVNIEVQKANDKWKKKQRIKITP